MAGLDNKISNIIATKLPQWLLNQIQTRSIANAKDSRDNDNLLFLANKSCWIRLVSSVNLQNQNDVNYFNRVVGGITKAEDLAKQFVLFGGTSKYLNKNSYQLRSGVADDGAYGILGDDEVKKYGYRPMPGIVNASIETQGRLGSVRSAVINFKCWDKAQLDIIDALYFKLGFTMFLEWGSTVYYKSNSSSTVQSSELLSIDPFQDALTKEQIYIQIAKNSRQSEGNYDAMLGIVTNFNFTFNQEGGYDCQIRLMALGALADSIKINNVGTLPALVEKEIRELNNTLINIAKEQNKSQQNTQESNFPDCVRNRGTRVTPPDSQKRFSDTAIQAKVNNINYFFYANGKYQTTGYSVSGTYECKEGILYIDNKTAEPQKFTYKEVLDVNKPKIQNTIVGTSGGKGYTINDYAGINYLAIDKFKALVPIGSSYNVTVNIDIPGLSKLGDAFTIQQGTSATDPNDLNFNITSISKDPADLLINADKYIKKEGDQINYSDNLGLLLNSKARGPIDNAATTGVGLKGQILNFLQSAADALEGRDQVAPYDASLFYKNKQATAELRLLYSNSTKYLNDEKIKSEQRRFSTSDKAFQDAIKSTIYSNQIDWKVVDIQDGVFILTYNLQIPKEVDNLVKNVQGDLVVSGKKTATFELELKLIVRDLDVIANVKIPPNSSLQTPTDFQIKQNLVAQNQIETITEEDEAARKAALDKQISEAIKSQSYLELSLRAIQLHALNRAINKRGIDIKKLVFTLNLKDDKTFTQNLFSNGIFSSFLDRLIDGSINESVYGTGDTQGLTNISRKQRLEVQSKYGFVSSLMGDSADIKTLSPCDFSTLLKAFVVPYQINQEVIKGVETNHPVYIPLGLLLMLLNHSCTLYDSEKPNTDQVPLVYIDFNTEHNYFLSNTKQLSTNPWVTLIPFEGSFKDYQTLFDTNILDKNSIKPPSGSTESVPLFNPEKDDALSSQLPPVKYDPSGNNIYRGRMMSILLNIDYLIKVVRDFSYRDGTNSIYLKEFIEQILSDLNKYLGKINMFRLSYNDKANTFQIVDDQFVPVRGEEQQLSPKNIPTTNNSTNRSNTTEIPLLGKYSIAKTLEIKSDISNKLSSMIAISSNAEYKDKASVSQNGDPYGYINTSYKDRYIVNKLGSPTASIVNLDAIINSAAQFNETVSDFYSKINPSETSVAHATNYFIDKMAKIKNDEYPTRASAMIPVSVNFTTDGLSGFLMGQGFTISDELLPYTYTNRIVPGAQGLEQDHINKVGFVVVGVNHTLDANQWTTGVRANMIFLKDATEFQGSVVKQTPTDREFGENLNNQSENVYVTIEKSTPIDKEESIKIAKTFFAQKGFSPVQISAIIGALLQESELSPNALNSIGAYGIAQWLEERKAKLLAKTDYNKLETQLAFIVEEFNSSESKAGNRLKKATTLEEAIAAMASYERYKGVTSEATYQDVLVAAETGNRIGYTKNIFNRYYKI